jgi:hypothetical protein
MYRHLPLERAFGYSGRVILAMGVVESPRNDGLIARSRDQHIRGIAVGGESSNSTTMTLQGSTQRVGRHDSQAPKKRIIASLTSVSPDENFRMKFSSFPGELNTSSITSQSNKMQCFLLH